MELAGLLKQDAKAKARFDALSFTLRKEMARSIESAKTAETRQRRIDKAVIELRAGN